MVSEIDESIFLKEKLAKDIVGEIVLSENPAGVIRKWREIFKITQKSLAGELGITSSVVSDYESGRRKSPGIGVIRKYVEALLEIDHKVGGNVTKGFAKTFSVPRLSDAIIDIREFSEGVEVEVFCECVKASLITRQVRKEYIYGYTIVDSLKAITEFSTQEMIKLYGLTTQRGLIFTKVSTGRTPMVAIKLTNLHPGLVVLHGLTVVDDIAKRIAEVEGIPLAVSRMEKVEDMVGGLRGFD